jgi:hypothetical protein
MFAKGRKLFIAYPLDLLAALITWRSEELLKAVLTVQFTLLLNESNILERAVALGVDARKVVRAPVLAHRSNEGASVIKVHKFY